MRAILILLLVAFVASETQADYDQITDAKAKEILKTLTQSGFASSYRPEEINLNEELNILSDFVIDNKNRFVSLKLYLAGINRVRQYNLQSKATSETYGQEIIDLIELYELKAIELCAKWLREDFDKLSKTDLEVLSSLWSKEKVTGIDADYLLEIKDDKDKLVVVISEALKRDVVSYDKHGKIKKESRNKFKLIERACSNLLKLDANGIEFIEQVLRDSKMSKKVLENQELTEMTAEIQICRAVYNKLITGKDVGSEADQIKDLFSDFYTRIV